ncbi:hypothetical protein MKY92_03190 [Paenibacillus sp. FSL R5-0623]|uniref:hypothetical protein n=1 Tax=Paenibacillus sp. FSL R5-0623 TaxID=2921651 RepID=UPI0030D848C8
MSVKSYQKIIPATAIQFEGNSSTHTDEIFAFFQVPISIDLAGGTVKLRVIVDHFDIRKKGQPIRVSVKKREVFESIENTIKNITTKELFERISSGNMRYALEFFDTMVTSGHTNLEVSGIATQDAPKLLYHWEVLKGVI